MPDKPAYPILDTIDSPADLRRLTKAELVRLAGEIRDFLVHTVTRTGGHLAANLGTVELSIALHTVFNTPHDKLVWDVGHQAYCHKILTGRREQMRSLRQLGGISGFPKRDESPYDTFGVGHSSTSISAALGMALAHQQRGQDHKTIAVIGDGAMTAGMAFEALNHAGDLNANLLVVLNDNDMSISHNVGGLSKYLSRILAGRFYTSMREGSKKVLSHLPSFREFARRWEEHMKGMLVPGTLFEELGFNYIGPVDGHDLPELIKTLENIRQLSGPQFLHVVTRKGKGHEAAEKDPLAWHGINATAVTRQTPAETGPSYTAVFGEWLCDMAEQEPRLIGITPAMCEGSGMVDFSQRFPERYFDVGIAEQHAVTLAAGLASAGKKPVVAIYSTFLQRAYDQLIHDVALQNLPVLFAIDRAGLVGPDGPTHAGSFDLSFLRCIPNLLIMAPADQNECRQMLDTGFHHSGPAAVRYPRGSGPATTVSRIHKPLPVGQAEIRRKGRRVALLAFGSMVAPAMQAAEALDATLVNMRFIKPLDEATILAMADHHELLVTVEENVIAGGAGSGVAELLSAHGHACRITHLGLPDAFIEHGSREELLKICGLDGAGIQEHVESLLRNDCKLEQKLIS